MRERLLVAMPIGGGLDVPASGGPTTGGSLTTIPICTTPDERGCVIGYHAYAATRRHGPTGRGTFRPVSAPRA